MSAASAALILTLASAPRPSEALSLRSKTTKSTVDRHRLPFRRPSPTTTLFSSAEDADNGVVVDLGSSADVSSALETVLRDGVAKMNTVMTPEFFSSSAALKSLHSQIIKNVEIRSSTVPGAGMGLFAKKNIKANSIVSFYPAHALGVDAGDDAVLPFVSVGGEDEEYFRTHPSARSGYLHCTDQPIFKRPSLVAQYLPAEWRDVPLYLDCNPNRPIVDGAWVSQIINDGARVESNTVKGVMEYYRATGQAKNCIHIPFGPSPVLATVVTKKVKKGKELFTSYGCTYWLGDLLGEGDEGNKEEAVGMTSAIQAQIRGTANDLFRSMEVATAIYGDAEEDLREAFGNIQVEI